MLTRLAWVLLQYPPISRTATTWVLVARAKAAAAVTMADNRTQAILPTGGRDPMADLMADPPVCLKALAAMLMRVRRAAVG